MVKRCKYLLVFSLLSVAGVQAWGQSRTGAAATAGSAGDKYVVPALTYLKANNPEQARQEIDKAFSTPEAKAGPKVLLAKAQIYFALNNSGKYTEDHLYREATKALLKLVDLKPDYERSTVDQLLLAGAYDYYNDGAQAYNDKKLSLAPELMKTVVKIHSLGNNTRFDKFPIAKQFDTVAADAYQIIASTAYYTGKYDDAIPMLINVKNNPITKTPSAFENLIYAYNIQKNSAKAYEVIQEARKTFPDDMTIRNYELDYFVNSGKPEDLLRKADAALAKDPQNADLLYDEAIVYMNMANPADGKKPENAGELHGKAEDAFQRAIALQPDNALFSYSCGTFYYNRAADVNEQMNAIKGVTDADNKRHDDLKAKSDALLAKALPYFERTYALLSPGASSLRDEDKKAYRSAMLALKEIYEAQNKKDKSAEMKSKYEAYNP
jgi:Tfp pilus assembly protein PilF